MINFIKKYIKNILNDASKENVEEFRIKIAESWFSEDYVEIIYSMNGRNWKTIRCYEYDVLEKWCYMKTKTIHFSNAEELLSKFKTLEDVKSYEDNERQRVIEKNAEISERNKKNKEERNKIYSKFS